MVVLVLLAPFTPRVMVVVVVAAEGGLRLRRAWARPANSLGWRSTKERSVCRGGGVCVCVSVMKWCWSPPWGCVCGRSTMPFGEGGAHVHTHKHTHNTSHAMVTK